MWVPVVFAPLVLVVVALEWVLASLGVFLRDLRQIVGVATTLVMFLSPVFYPASAVPGRFRPWLLLNPLSYVVEEARAVALAGRAPHWAGLAAYAAVSWLTAWLCLAWFTKTRRGFADVV